MKSRFRWVLFLVAILVTTEVFLASAQKEDQPKLETRTFTLAGYIPKFYDEAPQQDPFSDGYEKGIKRLKEYQDGMASFLQQHGVNVTPDHVQFRPHVNALILTDTAENLEMHEIMLRALFSPDMQLRAIDSATAGLKDDTVFEGDRLYRISFLDEVTVRAFHNEVRKLEEQLELLPENHTERGNIESRLADARKYRKSAVNLLLESLRQQRELIEKWQSETPKTEVSSGQPTTAPESKPDDKGKPQPEPEPTPR